MFPIVTGYSQASPAHWKPAIIMIAALLIMLLIMQLGQPGRLGRTASLAFSAARQLLHEADQENRSVRPLPLSLANLDS
jgi:hypothetical protein